MATSVMRRMQYICFFLLCTNKGGNTMSVESTRRCILQMESLTMSVMVRMEVMKQDTNTIYCSFSVFHQCMQLDADWRKMEIILWRKAYAHILLWVQFGFKWQICFFYVFIEFSSRFHVTTWEFQWGCKSWLLGRGIVKYTQPHFLLLFGTNLPAVLDQCLCWCYCLCSVDANIDACLLHRRTREYMLL